MIRRPCASTSLLKSPFFIAGGRHAAELRRRRALAVLLAGEHEERLVLAVVEAGDLHRAVDLESVLIEVVLHLRRAARVEQERVRVEPLAAVELVAGAVEAVGARLQRHVDDAAGGAPVLRVVGVGLDLELLHRVGRRHVGDVVAALVGVVRGAVEQELVVAVLRRRSSTSRRARRCRTAAGRSPARCR